MWGYLSYGLGRVGDMQKQTQLVKFNNIVTLERLPVFSVRWYSDDEIENPENTESWEQGIPLYGLMASNQTQTEKHESL